MVNNQVKSKLILGGIVVSGILVYYLTHKSPAEAEGDYGNEDIEGVNLRLSVVNALTTTKWDVTLVDGTKTKLIKPISDETAQYIPIEQSAKFIVPADTVFPLYFVMCQGVEPSQEWPEAVQQTFYFQSWNPDADVFVPNYYIDETMFNQTNLLIDLASGYFGPMDNEEE